MAECEFLDLLQDQPRSSPALRRHAPRQHREIVLRPVADDAEERELFPRCVRLMSNYESPRPMQYEDFCALAVSYIAPLYNAARRITGDPQEAEDLVQDTYQRALQAYRQLKSPAQCRAWLYRILRNVFIDTYRRKRTQPELVVLEGGRGGEEDIFSACTASTEEEVLRRLSNAEIHCALAALPEGLRTALTLCDIEGFTYPEIAEILGCPLGTVRSRIARARHTLLLKLRSQADTDGLRKEGREDTLSESL